ncbi:MAG: hypothetical protein DSZ35_05210 [Verrucomicrobia bacterium]|jgi:uncharacterized peroxidase-related enzyme|nr:carboxymuconolactone decarboxylase family protein [Candidatus Poseidoniales archaeon]RTZ68081.1 MAG: hypothetical protein DSZ35_05210 [Verrucomicrobiota bacterium]
MWIKTIPYGDSEGDLRYQYDRQVQTLGEPTEVTTSGSLHPPLVQARLDLYSATERCPSRLTAHQRNLISYVTSALNRTGHCMSQVTIKLRQTGFSDDQIASLAANPLGANLPPADAALVRYAAKLTTDPGSVTEKDIEDLRTAGFADLEILDANSQCSHLNYVNRVAMGLGIHSIVDPDFPAYDAIPAAAEGA